MNGINRPSHRNFLLATPQRRYLVGVAAWLAALLAPLTVLAQGTAFTYQGRLTDGPGPATGLYDLRFTLFDTLSNGTASAGPLTNMSTAVNAGLFTVTLDFGPGVFTGPPRWLEIGARTNGNGAFGTIVPRQQLAAAPYAIFAGIASNLSGTVPVSQLSGVLPSLNLSGTYSNAITFNNPGNSFIGNGGGLTNVNALTLGGLGLSNFWRLGGNSGLPSPASLGSLNFIPVEIRVNGQRGLRIEPNTNGGPNVIGGSSVNFVAGNVSGATIGGGGATNFLSGPGAYLNSVAMDFGTIGGGLQNEIDGGIGEAATISGGEGNYITNSGSSVIGGGYRNSIEDAGSAAIVGGFENQVWNSSSFIGGGSENVIGGPSSRFGTPQPNNDNVIVGGNQNAMGGFFGVAAGTIGGGFANVIANCQAATIPGGAFNLVQGDYSYAAGSNAQALHVGCFVWADAIGQPFSSGGENQFLIRASGGVGIGKTNPASALDVNGIISGTGFSGNGTGLSGVALLTGGNTLSGNQVLSSGRMGIGTTAPEAPLHVANGSAGAVTANANSLAVFEKNTSAYVSVLAPATAEMGILFGNPNNNADGGIVFNNANVPHGLEFRTGGSATQMTIQAGGNVGIGTINPNRTLHLVSTGDTELGIQSADANGHLWTLQSSAVNGSGRDGSFQIIDRTPGFGFARLLIATNGNVGIGTTSPSQLLDVAGNIIASGSICANNGVNCASDRNAKENFTPVNSRDILEKVAQLPVSHWNYKTDPQTPHLGPMAQDFHAAFGVGTDDRHIAVVDEGGVALAAIQGLNQKLEASLVEVQELKEEVASLRKLVQELSHDRTGGSR